MLEKCLKISPKKTQNPMRSPHRKNSKREEKRFFWDSIYKLLGPSKLAQPHDAVARTRAHSLGWHTMAQAQAATLSPLYAVYNGLRSNERAWSFDPTDMHGPGMDRMAARIHGHDPHDLAWFEHDFLCNQVWSIVIIVSTIKYKLESLQDSDVDVVWIITLLMRRSSQQIYKNIGRGASQVWGSKKWWRILRKPAKSSWV